MNRYTVLFGFFLLALTSSPAVQRSELSAEAQALVPEGGGMVEVITHQGKKYEGVVTMEDSIKIMLKFKKPGGTIFQTVPIMKADIKTKAPTDVAPILFNALVGKYQLEKVALSEPVYERAISLFDEFIAKAPRYPQILKIRDLRQKFSEELGNLQRGLKKVGPGEWTTPVRGTVMEFNMYTHGVSNSTHSATNDPSIPDPRPDAEIYEEMGIEALEKSAGFRTNKVMQAVHKELIDKRRAAVRVLPGLVRSTVPRMISSGNYSAAVDESVSFLQFWCGQVVGTEGPAGAVMNQMDFGQIIQLQRMIMSSYTKAGQGKEGTNPSPDSRTMVFIPGGYFLMGKEGNDSSSPEFPLHIVYVGPFMIGKYEVTNKEYRKFVEHVKSTGDSSMEHPDSPLMKKHDPEGWKYPGLSRDNQPVVGVDWFDAYAYCKWKGVRLPTEAEWEKAARTMDERKFPWGNKAPKEMEANYARSRAFMAAEMDRQHPPQSPQPQGGCACVKKEVPPPAPTVLPDETWNCNKQLPQQAIDAISNDFMIWDKKYEFANGIMHMAGNAAEWVYDFYDTSYYWKSPVENPKGPATGDYRVFRGGSYLSTKPDELAAYLRSTPTHAKMIGGCMPDGRPFIGFRVVKDLGMSGTFPEDQQ